MAENCASNKSLSNVAFFSLLILFALFGLHAGVAYAAPPADIASRSIIYNDGTQSESVYLLMKIQWYNPSTGDWVDEATVYQSSGPITIAPAGTLNLSTYFNGLWNTSSASRGPGTYRVWAGAHDSGWNLLNRSGNIPIESGYPFTIIGSSVARHKYIFAIRDSTGSVISNTVLRVYNTTSAFPDFTFNALSASREFDLQESNKYGIKYILPSGAILEIKNLTIAVNTTMNPQYVETYSGYLPSSATASSAVIALNDTLLSYGKAELTFPLKTESNAVLHCKNWNYASANCSSWSITMLTNMSHYKNSTHLLFDVAEFDAYLAANYTEPFTCPAVTDPPCIGGTVVSGFDSNGCRTQGTCNCPVDTTYTGEICTPSSQGDSQGGGGGGNMGGGSAANTVEYATLAKIVNYPGQIKVSSGGFAEFSIIVKNTGKKHINSISLEFSQPWFEYDKKTFSLLSEESKTISVKIAIPPSVKQGPYFISAAIKGDSEDKVSFTVSVVGAEGVSSVVEIDVGAVKDMLEDLKGRINMFSARGYNTTASEELASKAEELFKNGDMLGSTDYMVLANDALDKAIKKTDNTKNYLASYFLSGIIVCLLFLLYYFYRKYLEEKQANEIHAKTIAMHEQTLGKLNEKRGLNFDKKQPLPVKSDEQNTKDMEKSDAAEKAAAESSQSAKKEDPVDMLDQDIKMDDLVKKLEEIRKKVVS